jgi:hypothetical protein
MHALWSGRALTYTRIPDYSLYSILLSPTCTYTFKEFECDLRGIFDGAVDYALHISDDPNEAFPHSSPKTPSYALSWVRNPRRIMGLS